MDDELMTTRDVAAALHVDPRTVARWIREGKLRAVRIKVGKRVIYRIRRPEFSRFFARYVRYE